MLCHMLLHPYVFHVQLWRFYINKMLYNYQITYNCANIMVYAEKRYWKFLFICANFVNKYSKDLKNNINQQFWILSNCPLPTVVCSYSRHFSNLSSLTFLFSLKNFLRIYSYSLDVLVPVSTQFSSCDNSVKKSILSAIILPGGSMEFSSV